MYKKNLPFSKGSIISCFKRSGFTKSEVLIVTVILLCLGWLGQYNFYLAQAKARDFERREQLKRISAALEDYVVDVKSFPPTGPDYQLTGCGDLQCPSEENTGIACNWNHGVPDLSLSCGEFIYIAPLPQAPLNEKLLESQAHRYLRLEPRKMVLETCLELSSDIEAVSLEQSLTGLTEQNCLSGVMFQVLKG